MRIRAQRAEERAAASGLDQYDQSMTERVHSITIHFERDVREDDLEHLIGALRMVKGVVAVVTSIASIESSMAVERARREMLERLLTEAQR